MEITDVQFVRLCRKFWKNIFNYSNYEIRCLEENVKAELRFSLQRVILITFYWYKNISIYIYTWVL